jgi:gamma-glutamyltranspeptidase
VPKTVTPVINNSIPGSIRYIWEAVASGDTLVAVATPNGSATNAAVQILGTFGSATITLQASNEGTTFYSIKDMHGTAISTTSAAGFEFVSSAAYLRPTSAGGTADDIDIILTLRG